MFPPIWLAAGGSAWHSVLSQDYGPVEQVPGSAGTRSERGLAPHTDTPGYGARGLQDGHKGEHTGRLGVDCFGRSGWEGYRCTCALAAMTERYVPTLAWRRRTGASGCAAAGLRVCCLYSSLMLTQPPSTLALP